MRFVGVSEDIAEDRGKSFVVATTERKINTILCLEKHSASKHLQMAKHILTNVNRNLLWRNLYLSLKYIVIFYLSTSPFCHSASLIAVCEKLTQCVGCQYKGVTGGRCSFSKSEMSQTHLAKRQCE